MQLKRCLSLVGTLAALGCGGPWVTEAGDVPVASDAPRIEPQGSDHNQLGERDQPAPIRRFVRRGKKPQVS